MNITRLATSAILALAAPIGWPVAAQAHHRDLGLIPVMPDRDEWLAIG
jgi:hypothetical protein